MNTIFLGLGANVGKKQKNITDAIALLQQKITSIHTAPFYMSKAVGYTDQDDFVNTVAQGETMLSPDELLRFVKYVEKEIGRIHRFRWGPREIDIDILFYNHLVYKSAAVEIPHPRLHERDFVLIPLRNIAPEYNHPSLHKSIEQLLRELPEKKKAVFQKIA